MSSINNVSAQGASRAYVHNADAAQTSAAQTAEKAARRQQHTSKADSVTLSDNARSLAAAREAVQKAPEVREEKVAEIKQRVSDGTYSVSSRVPARKIVDAAKNPS